MKKYLLLLLLTAVSLLNAAECRKHYQAFVGPTEKGEPFFFENKLNNYVITFRYTNPGPTAPPYVLAGMPAPVNLNGFSRYSFTWLTVNGINSRNLEPKKFEMFNKKDSAGVDAHYNFNGVHLIQRFWMNDKTPLLYMTWLRGKNVPAGAIKNMSIEFNVMPCASGMPKRNSYAREIVTPRGTLRTPEKLKRKRHKLTKQDVYMILQDAKYQPGKEPQISSPVLLVPDWKSLKTGMAIFGVGQNMSVSFTLDPNASKWEFGLLDTSKKRSNQEFAAFVKNLL
jgi:hypothetical protein